MHSSRRKKLFFFVTCGDYGGWISNINSCLDDMLCYAMLYYAMLCYAMHVHRLLRTIDDIVTRLDAGRPVDLNMNMFFRGSKIWIRNCKSMAVLLQKCVTLGVDMLNTSHM